MSWNDQEAIDAERFDADMEQAAMEAEGDRLYRASQKSKRLAQLGEFGDAARACPHGGGYPLNSPAAENENDPAAGQEGVRCWDCGSRLTDFVWNGGTVLIACELKRAS